MVWQPRIQIGSGSKFMGLVEAIEEDVAAGLLAEGERMPPQRGVAEALGIDLTTVTRAYGEAKLRGVLTASPGRGGTRVAVSSGVAAARALAHPVDLRLNIPPQPASADLAARLGRTVQEILRGGAGLLQYGPPEGTETDRMAGAAWLRSVAGAGLEARIVVAGGAQASLFAICAASFASGDAIAASEVTYPGLMSVAGRLGLEIVPLAMDEEGICPDAFSAACARRGLKALYVVPTIDNPTAATMSLERREAIVVVARRHGVAIIEDDPYRRLLDDPPQALAVLAPERTTHIATLAKCASPGLRIAYVVSPNVAEAMGVASVLRTIMLMAPPLMAAAATRWIADGTLARVTAAIREESRARQMTAVQSLRGIPYRAHPNGHHLWLPLAEGWRADDFAARAARSGVAVVPGAAFAVGGAQPRAVRVSLGSAPDRTALASGLRRLAELIAEGAGKARVFV